MADLVVVTSNPKKGIRLAKLFYCIVGKKYTVISRQHEIFLLRTKTTKVVFFSVRIEQPQNYFIAHFLSFSKFVTLVGWEWLTESSVP